MLCPHTSPTTNKFLFSLFVFDNLFYINKENSKQSKSKISQQLQKAYNKK